MKIRRVDVENFRGVRRCSWRLPKDQSFFVLVGPGDSTKSTILTAIERALSERWNVAFSDSDFYDGVFDEPIRIRIAVSELPDDLLSLDAFGHVLCGIDDVGDWTHDPSDEHDECVIVELRVDADLEPQWLAFRPDEEEEEEVQPHSVRARDRARFGAFRIDERVDAHLRWSRMSALGKLTEKRHETKKTLTTASRAARDAAAEAVSPELKELTDDIHSKVRDIGSADFKELKPGLDMSLNSSQGNLALFDGQVPLTNFGLGTRRLVGAATQQLAHDGAALLLVDEVEYGLEPHRLVHLLSHLRNKDAFSQVFVTTHSPTALQHLDAADLVMVRSHNGETTVKSLGDPSSLQPIIRSEPEAFLSRRIVVCEGKTEYGLVLAMLNHWNAAAGNAHVPSAALGVVAFEGGGGTHAADKALELLKVGYEVTLFVDSDDAQTNKKVSGIEAEHGVVVQWPGEVCTELAIANQLDAAGLTRMIDRAVASADDRVSAADLYTKQLETAGAPADATRDVTTWVSSDLTLERARTIIGTTARDKKWFKNVEKGKQLAELILAEPSLAIGQVAVTIANLKSSIYEPRVLPAPEAAGTSGDAVRVETPAAVATDAGVAPSPEV